MPKAPQTQSKELELDNLVNEWPVEPVDRASSGSTAWFAQLYASGKPRLAPGSRYQKVPERMFHAAGNEENVGFAENSCIGSCIAQEQLHGAIIRPAPSIPKQVLTRTSAALPWRTLILDGFVYCWVQPGMSCGEASLLTCFGLLAACLSPDPVLSRIIAAQNKDDYKSIKLT